ncbi:MAG: flagellar protein FlaG [Burkholderiales bacterium]|uniref:flagellar protein FlaG n=1 Tax=Limnobacter sp. TaxID=2003368 RepID=UPI0039BCFB6E|nr:flagellar protein FlaG [Burkholderiales bacterium]
MNISNMADYATALQKPQEIDNIKPVPAVAAKPLMGEQAELSVGEVLEVVQKANAALTSNQSNLKFLVDSDNGKPIVQIIDRETQEVLKQIPSVEMLKIAKAIEKMQGVLMSREV